MVSELDAKLQNHIESLYELTSGERDLISTEPEILEIFEREDPQAKLL